MSGVRYNRSCGRGRPQLGTDGTLASRCGHVVAVGSMFDAWLRLKNEASLHAYSLGHTPSPAAQRGTEGDETRPDFGAGEDSNP